MKAKFNILPLVFFLVFLGFPLTGRGEPENFVYRRLGRRDPFVPLLNSGSRGGGNLLTVEAVGDIVLEGIVWDSRGESLVVINGEILNEGSRFQNVEILKIERETVRVLINEKEYSVGFGEEVK